MGLPPNHQLGVTRQTDQYLLDFRFCEYNGQAFRSFGANILKSRFDSFTKHFPVEEQNGAERLILCGGCHLPFYSQVG